MPCSITLTKILSICLLRIEVVDMLLTDETALEKANKILKEHGIEKFLFGSDFPMWDHEDEMGRFNKLDLTPEERQKILYDNAVELLKRIKA